MTISNVWTPAMMATFRALHRAGGSFEEMARQMSGIFQLEITRNALIGKARRMELPMRKDDGTRKPPPTPAKPVVTQRPVPVAAPIPPPPPEPAETEEGLSIYQLTSTTCRWPLGGMQDRPPFRFCGEAAPIEEPYCAKHHAIGSNRPRQTWE